MYYPALFPKRKRLTEADIAVNVLIGLMKHFMSVSGAPTALVDAGDLCGECPVWVPDQHRLYWTDCVGLSFHCFDWRTRVHRVLAKSVEVYGFRPNVGGGFVVTNTAGIWLWEPGGKLRPVASDAAGQQLQLNDCCADAQGRLLTMSFFYDPAGGYKLGRLIRIDNTGAVNVLDEGFHLGNGIGFSPNQRVLYVTDTIARRIYAYDYQTVSGSVSRRRVFVEVPADEGVPDGLAVDAEGFVWSAQWYGACVVRYDPDGYAERRIAVPAKQTSSVEFGGTDLTDIFITSAAQSEKLPVMPAGYDPDSGVIGGSVYHVNLGIAGQPQRIASIHPRDSNAP
jgi:D-xylonolactonase